MTSTLCKTYGSSRNEGREMTSFTFLSVQCVKGPTIEIMFHNVQRARQQVSNLYNIHSGRCIFNLLKEHSNKSVYVLKLLLKTIVRT